MQNTEKYTKATQTQ